MINSERAVRRSQSEVNEILLDWERSDQSAAAFCRSRGLNPATFYRWRRTHLVSRLQFAEVRVEGVDPSLREGVCLLRISVVAGDTQIEVYDRGLAEQVLQWVARPTAR